MVVLQHNLFLPESAWQLPDLNSLPSWDQFKRIGLDVETRDTNLFDLGPGAQRDGKVVGWCLAFEDGPAPVYLPVGHRQGTNLNPDNVLSYIRDNAKNFSGTVVGANLSYDLDYLCEELGDELGTGTCFPKVQAFKDTQNADPLINENHHRYGLDAVAERWGLPHKVEDRLREAAEAYGVSPKSGLYLLDPKYVGEYGEGDALRPLQIMRRQEREISEQGLEKIWELETQVLPALVRMKRRGVAVDFDRLGQIENWCADKEQEQLKQVYRHSGRTLNVDDLSAAAAIAPILFSIGAQLQKNAKNKQWNIDAQVLKSLKHPVATAILNARKINKIRRDFIRSVRQHAVNGRIHCSFNQLKRPKSNESEEGTAGTVTGRLSATNPNMQQQPSPKDTDPETMQVTDELSLMWREIYVPDEGGEWACLDYSQQEPRILHHFAELTNCPGAKAACNKYRDDTDNDNHSMFAEMTGLPRKQAKILYLGKCYRMGGAKFAVSLGLPTMRKLIGRGDDQKWITTAGPEADVILKQFSAGAPYIDALAKKVERAARKKGHITTLLGRRCRFGMDHDGNRLGTHRALNRLIQGSAADQTKKALVEADRAGIRLQLQVHDELDLTIWDRSEAEELAKIMRECAPLTVPSKVDIETGPNWGQIK